MADEKMERNEIVKSFLEKGKLLTPEALDFLSTQNTELLLRKTYKNFILKKQDFEEDEEKESVIIIKNLIEKPKELTTNDLLNFYTSKYEKMRDIITNRG